MSAFLFELDMLKKSSDMEMQIIPKSMAQGYQNQYKVETINIQAPKWLRVGWRKSSLC